MSTPAILCLALLLDAALGEPRWLWDRVPHPAVLIGRVIGWAEHRLNQGHARRIMGVALVVGLVLSAWIIGGILSLFGWPLVTVAVAILLAQKSLVQHVGAVADGLRLSLGDGRRAVALIVSRDTGAMEAPAVARSAIESAAENLSDGVVAPAFWFLIGGLPGILIYKAINTADSMIGYRNERYEEFGWAAARLDDLLNWVPARLTAVMIAAFSHGLGQWDAIAQDARKHRSPNAGWPEAAMSRALDVALAGPRAYHGKMRDFPFVNDAGRKTIGASEIEAACTMLWKVWALLLAVSALLILI